MQCFGLLKRPMTDSAQMIKTRYTDEARPHRELVPHQTVMQKTPKTVSVILLGKGIDSIESRPAVRIQSFQVGEPQQYDKVFSPNLLTLNNMKLMNLFLTILLVIKS